MYSFLFSRLKNIMCMLHWIPDYRVCLAADKEKKEQDLKRVQSFRHEHEQQEQQEQKGATIKGSDLISSALDGKTNASAPQNKKKEDIAKRLKVAADLEHLGILKQAFSFFDEDGSGGLYGDQLIRCLEAVDVRFDDCHNAKDMYSRLSSLMHIIDKNADDIVTFPEFKGMVEGHILDHSIAGVYFVIVTLAEAEAIRAGLHNEKRLGGLTKKDVYHHHHSNKKEDDITTTTTTTVDYSAIAISLGKTIIDSSKNWNFIFKGSDQSFRGKYMIDAASQVLRYVNSDLNFDERQRSMVLRTVEKASCVDRQLWFER